MIENPFEQWGLDVVGEINPNSLKLHKYILTTTDYFSKWTEATPLKVINDTEVIQFLQRNVGNMVILIGIDVNEWDNNEEDDWRYDESDDNEAYMHN